jgi:hypothetical protein
MRHHTSVDDSGVFQPASATLSLAGIDETVNMYSLNLQMVMKHESRKRTWHKAFVDFTDFFLKKSQNLIAITL